MTTPPTDEQTLAALSQYANSAVLDLPAEDAAHVMKLKRELRAIIKAHNDLGVMALVSAAFDIMAEG